MRFPRQWVAHGDFDRRGVRRKVSTADAIARIASHKQESVVGVKHLGRIIGVRLRSLIQHPVSLRIHLVDLEGNRLAEFSAAVVLAGEQRQLLHCTSLEETELAAGDRDDIGEPNVAQLGSDRCGTQRGKRQARKPRVPQAALDGYGAEIA